MAPMGEHGTAVKRHDHLWVAVIIGACALIEVWATWLGLGSISGFPKLGRMTTGWILPVTTEAYWGYALWSWLTSRPGRAKKFAMWTAGIMFVLSLLGQESGHLTPSGRPAATLVVIFVTALPLVSLALIAVLVHLRQLDREDADKAAQDVAEARESDRLRAALDAERQARGADVRGLQEELAGERGAREKAEQEAARRPAIEADRDRWQAEAKAARTAAEAAETARTETARNASAAGDDAALREARLRELEIACGSLETELRTVREARATETRNLQASLDAERRARENAGRGAVLLPVVQQQLEEARTAAQAARAAADAAETARAEAEQRAARAEAKAASLTRTAPPRAGSKSARAGAPGEDSEARTQLEVAREAREKADEILAGRPDISGAELAALCGMKERWGQTHKKQYAERETEQTA